MEISARGKYMQDTEELPLMVSMELSYYLLPCEKDTNLVDKYLYHIYMVLMI